MGHEAHPGSGGSATELSVTENRRGRGGDGPSCFGSLLSPWSILLTCQNNSKKGNGLRSGGTEATSKESPRTGGDPTALRRKAEICSNSVQPQLTARQPNVRQRNRCINACRSSTDMRISARCSITRSPCSIRRTIKRGRTCVTGAGSHRPCCGSSWQGVRARLVRREPTTHVGVHRIARNNHRVRTTALLAVERAVFKTQRSSLGFRMTHVWFVASWTAGPIDMGKVG